jgi:predicted nucleic acid-binding protein
VEREGRAAKDDVARQVAAFDEAWQDIAVVELVDEIARRAVAIARDHPLRASDAIHLASAFAVAPSEGTVTFACFDRRLWDAAEALGFGTIPLSPP